MRKLTICLMLLLSGCAAIADQQRAQQEAWDALTPQQQMVELERRRVAIEQQRANNEQIQRGLQMIRSGSTSPTIHCSTYQAGPFTNTDCN